MYRYIDLIEGQGVLARKHLWCENKTSTIYKDGNFLYKIAIKSNEHYRNKLDLLLNNRDLNDVGALPIEKIRTNLGKYGLKMNYLNNTKTLWACLRENRINPEDMISIMIIASDNLKKINNRKIKFSDLHHNNILIDNNMNPYYIDFDDAVIEDYSSNHISCMSYDLHEVDKKSRSYRDQLIKDGNLDRENLFIIFLNYILKVNIEKKKFLEFQDLLDDLDQKFPDDFVQAISELKRYHSNEVIPFNHYLGDYLKQDSIKKKCLKIGGLYG